jgi:L-threonylcarbamoyladenylate synthase
MRIFKKNNLHIKDIVYVLARGGLIIYPTETMYGIGVDATNPIAIKKLSYYKKRPLGKPYSIAVVNQKMAEEYVSLNNSAKNLYKNFLPGPITVVSKGKHRVAPGVESETGTLGIRIPDYPLVLKILKVYGKPITATSANASYQKRPYKVSDILDNISSKQKSLIDLIIDAGELPHHEPSTVVDTTLDDVTILRQGDIKLKDKNKILSRSEENTQNIAKDLWQKYEKYHGLRAIIFALEGQMGSGKTQFVKGLARGTGIKEGVVSPTFNIELDYENKKRKIKLVHIDAWRMSSEKEIADLQFDKKINEKSILAIEWADRVAGYIRSYQEEAIIIWVKIEYPSYHDRSKSGTENERLISWGVI